MGARVGLDQIGRKILNETRTELCLSMHFMVRPLSMLSFVMDLNTRRCGTNGESIFFNPTFLYQLFLESPQKLDRLYLHMILHCLFRHIFDSDGRDEKLWGLACDIQTEYVLDSMEYDIIRRPPGEYRERVYEILKKEKRILTAERIYAYLSKHQPDYEELSDLSFEFVKDDHQYWRVLEEEGGGKKASGHKQDFDRNASALKHGKNSLDENIDSRNSNKGRQERQNVNQKEDSGSGSSESKRCVSDNEPKNRDRKSRDRIQDLPEELKRELFKDFQDVAPSEKGSSAENEEGSEHRGRLSRARRDELSDEWKRSGEKLSTSLLSFSREAGRETGSLQWILRAEYERHVPFQAYLKRFALEREEARIDPESFDYGYYHYGMEIYGNMPLIEENEYRDSKKIRDLVIAIDTSASCRTDLVQRFLDETASILSDREGFFERVHIHLLQCDNQIQSDTLITHVSEMKELLQHFTARGGYGTDFRPVFRYVGKLKTEGKLPGLKGLLYFTDGFGIFPEKAPSYETAFIFPKDSDNGAEHAPDWALKLYL